MTFKRTKKMNQETNNNKGKEFPSDPKSWSEIEKAQWKKYEANNPAFTQILKDTNFTLSTTILALEGMYNRVNQHYSQPLFEGEEQPWENSPIHKNIYDLVSSKDLLRVSYKKLSSNRGSMTPGGKGVTADSTSEEKIEKISQELKKGLFKWTPVNRIEVQKPGRKKGVMRPIGLPDFDDKMVQNNILLILTSIYEPEFQYYNTNWGFRPNMHANDAIKHIRLQCKSYDYAIEGDIVGAYDNIQHNILIKILRKRISDEKFLQLIYDALKAGYMKDNTYYDSFLGTPQGGIHSPILFNIYMHEFDKWITHTLPQKVDELNSKIKTNSTLAKNPESNNSRRRIARVQEKLEVVEKFQDFYKKIKLPTEDVLEIYDSMKEIIHEKFSATTDGMGKREQNTYQSFKQNAVIVGNYNPTPEELQIISSYDIKRKHEKNSDTKIIDTYPIEHRDIIANHNRIGGTEARFKRNLWTYIEKYNLQEATQEIYKKILTKSKSLEKSFQLNLTSLIPSKKRIEFKFYRYADDWILFVKGSVDATKTIKNLAGQWIKENLSLELSPEKTFITDLKQQKAHFLGFEIFNQTNKQIVRRKAKTGSFLQRYGNLQIMPDIERLTKKFQIKNYLTSEKKIVSVGFLTPLQDHQIIEKFNQFMIGIGNYYITEISRASALNYWHYILYYSCLKTLSHKHKSSVSKIINGGYLDISKKHKRIKTRTRTTRGKLIQKRLRNKGKKIRGFDKRIVSSYTTTKGEKRYTILLNYNQFRMEINKIRDKYRNDFLNRPSYPSPTIDFLILHKNNWRTKFRLSSMCVVCGAQDRLEMHHIKHVKNQKGKGKLYAGFDKLVASLSRKQVCVCQTCHNKIHNGDYNSTRLSDLIDLRIANPESLLKVESEETATTITEAKKIQIKNRLLIKVDEEKKTYYNPELAEYYESLESKKNKEEL